MFKAGGTILKQDRHAQDGIMVSNWSKLIQFLKVEHNPIYLHLSDATQKLISGLFMEFSYQIFGRSLT